MYVSGLFNAPKLRRVSPRRAGFPLAPLLRLASGATATRSPPKFESILSINQNERDLARLISPIHPGMIGSPLDHRIPGGQVHL
jgi:hypothetical protein